MNNPINVNQVLKQLTRMSATFMIHDIHQHLLSDARGSLKAALLIISAVFCVL